MNKNAPLDSSGRKNIRSQNWKMGGILAIILGMVFLASSIIAISYYVVPSMGSTHDYPYQNYAFPLFLAGAILLVTGVIARLKLRTR